MTVEEILQAVYQKGKRCRGCPYNYGVVEKERLSGRSTAIRRTIGCRIVEHKEGWDTYTPEECPGVEDELARSKDD